MTYEINTDCTDETLREGAILSMSLLHFTYCKTQQQTGLSHSRVSHQHDFEHEVTSIESAFSMLTIPDSSQRNSMTTSHLSNKHGSNYITFPFSSDKTTVSFAESKRSLCISESKRGYLSRCYGDFPAIHRAFRSQRTPRRPLVKPAFCF